MKQILDFFPLVIFFIVYKITPHPVEFGGFHFSIGGIYSATLLLIISTAIIYGFQYFRQKKLDKSQIITLVAVFVLGGLTLIFHSDTFIKWKAPIINWIFGIAFILSPYVSEKPLVKRVLEQAISLPEPIWKKLNLSWAVFFLLLGTANLYVAFTFERFWVDFKVFGSLGLTLLFMIVQFIMLSKHMRPVEKNKQS